MKPFASHGLAYAIGSADYRKHLPEKEVGMIAYMASQGRATLRQVDCNARIRNFTKHLLNSNSGLVIAGESLFANPPCHEQGRRAHFVWRLQKLCGEVDSAGLSGNLLFVVDTRAHAKHAQRFLPHGSVPNALFTLREDGQDSTCFAGNVQKIRNTDGSPILAQGEHATLPIFEVLAHFVHDLDRIIIGGVLKDVQKTAAGLEKLCLELGIRNKRIEPAYHFTLDGETGQLIISKSPTLLAQSQQ
jgi:hypothetical protein